MSRATAVYVITFVCLVAGMWVVLGLGAELRPQPDLSGTWELENDVSVGGWPAFGRVLEVEQSGLFVRFQFDNAVALDLKITGHRTEQRGDRHVPVVVMQGGSAPEVEAVGNLNSGRLRLRFIGPSDVAETPATRTARTYADPDEQTEEQDALR